MAEDPNASRDPAAADRLRSALLEPAAAARLRASGSVRAAVLVAIYDWPARPGLIFTERRHDMRRHPGQISFPGGRIEPGEDPVAAALREADEEIGLDPASVEVIGSLRPVGTFVSDYEVHPVVGLIDAGSPARLVPNPGEVAAVLALGLDELRAGHGVERVAPQGIPFETPVYRVGIHMIWGATARILGELLEKTEAPS